MPILTFGKYKDQNIMDVPLSYVQWLKENTKGPSQQMAADEIKRRNGESVTAKYSRDQWVMEFQKLVDKMPDGLHSQKVKYKNLEITVNVIQTIKETPND